MDNSNNENTRVNEPVWRRPVKKSIKNASPYGNWLMPSNLGEKSFSTINCIYSNIYDQRHHTFQPRTRDINWSKRQRVTQISINRIPAKSQNLVKYFI